MGKSGSVDDVVELTDDNFDKLVLNSGDIWLVEFYAPWCGHCKNLAPQWAQAARELKGKAKLGALDATVHSAKASQYGIKGYPTIKFFPAGSRSASAAEEYDGGRTASDIVNWASGKAVANIPAPEVKQVTSSEVKITLRGSSSLYCCCSSSYPGLPIRVQEQLLEDANCTW